MEKTIGVIFVEEENLEHNYCVYIHTNKINGKKYVGITSKEPYKRWGNNGNKYLNKNSNGHYVHPIMANALLKYNDWDNDWLHEIVYSNLTEEEASEMEIKLIALYKTNCCRYHNPSYGYNMTDGGQHGPVGVKRTNEIKEKLRDLNLGSNNPNFGLKRSDETKQKIKTSLTGKSKTYKDDNGDPLKISIYQYDLNGNMIREYSCASEAHELTGIGKSAIENCMYGISKTAGGYLWKRSNEPLTGKDIQNVHTGTLSVASWFDKEKQKYRVKFKKDGKYVKTKTYNTKEETDVAILKYLNN